MKNFLRMITQRAVLVSLAILIQLIALLLVFFQFSEYFVYFYAVCETLSILVVLYIINGKSNPGYKIAWIVPILIVPVFGWLFYLMFGGNRTSKRTRKRLAVIRRQTLFNIPDNGELIDEVDKDCYEAAKIMRYLNRYADAPVYRHTQSVYLPMGEIKFQFLLDKLRKAEKFIFLEYFIIGEGYMWDTILEILKEKAAAGVDVRLIYDDFGSIQVLPYRYDRELKKYGIQCRVFNPFIPIVSSRLNNRDHRKIAIIDGHTAFTGGINLADEYINKKLRFGHWKDTAVMLQGEAVWSMTVMFLSMWDYLSGQTENYEPFRVPGLERTPSDGFVQPFSDSPLDDEPVGETVYLSIINAARNYLYITTPYLIIDNEMVTALTMAAKSGVDVRIITPSIPDKWYVHAVTKAYYSVLLESGIRIYEYTPGFIHAKTVASDDRFGVVGTINFDYRSLYLHFECAAFLYQTGSVWRIKEDFLETLEKCREVQLPETKERGHLFKKLGRAILRAFAPLM